MPHSCSALHCINRYKRGCPITFHKFPRDSHVLKLWLDAVKRENWVPTNASRLCSEHFQSSDFRDVNGRKYLKEKSVPSKFNFPTHKMKKSNIKRAVKRKLLAIDDVHPAYEVISLLENTTNIISGSNMKVHPMRLLPGMEIKSSLLEYVKCNKLNAAFILTCCGSITKATLRFATSPDREHQIRTLNQCFEITSLVGTICEDGAHLHITLGDSEGNTVSGHVVGDLIVQTTAEIVLGEICGVQFKREFDKETGWKELVIMK